jgi:hypothetical protein
MVQRAFGLVVSLVLLVATPARAQGSCSADADCQPGQACVEGTCAASEPSANAAACMQNADCETGQACVQGTCGVSQQTPEPAAAAGECTTNADCGAGRGCSAGRCVAPAPAPTLAANSSSDGMSAADDFPMDDVGAEEPKYKRNTSMMVVGIVATAVGGVALLAGGVSLGLADAESTEVCNNGDCRPATKQERSDLRTVGWVGLIGGGILTAVGLPLIIHGAKKRPVQEASVTTTVGVVVGPAAGSVLVTF